MTCLPSFKRSKPLSTKKLFALLALWTHQQFSKLTTSSSEAAHLSLKGTHIHPFLTSSLYISQNSFVLCSPTPQTDTVPVADTQHIDNTEGHTSSTDESDLESVSEASEISAHSLLPLPRPPAKKRKLKTPPAKKRKLEKPPVIWTSAMVRYFIVMIFVSIFSRQLIISFLIGRCCGESGDKVQSGRLGRSTQASSI